MLTELQELVDSLSGYYPDEGLAPIVGRRHVLVYHPHNGELLVEDYPQDFVIRPPAYDAYMPMFEVPPMTPLYRLCNVLGGLGAELLAVRGACHSHFIDAAGMGQTEWSLGGIAWLYHSRFPLITQRLSQKDKTL